jgi:hypothetical protein
MPAVLLGILVGLVGIGGIVWWAFCFVERNKDQIPLPSMMVVLALGGLIWLLISTRMPLEIEREEIYNPVVANYENGTRIQTIRVHSEIININNIFGGYLAEDKAVKKVYYREWYAGLWYQIEVKYFIIDKVKEKNVEKDGVKESPKQP